MKRKTFRRQQNPLVLKFQSLIRSTWLYNKIVEYIRKARSGRLGKFNVRNIKSPISYLPENLRRAAPLSAIGIIIFLVIYSIFVFLSISPVGYETGDLPITRKRTFDSAINILSIGFENRLNSYKYIEYLNIISVDTKNGLVKIYGISPDFKLNIDGDQVTIESLWNNIEDIEGKAKIDSLTTQLQTFLAIRLDRYIAFDMDGLKSYLKTTQMNAVTYDAFSENSHVYNPGDLISGDLLYNYLFDKTEGRDIITLRQMSFQKNLLESIKGPIKSVRNALDFKNFNKTFFTNMSREEYVGFLSNLNASDIAFSTQSYLSDRFGVKSKDPLDKSVDPDFGLIDENISAFFADIDIMKEQAAIEIYNATDVAGLAGNRRRFFQNNGANIVKFGNYPISGVEQTLLYVPSKNLEMFKNNIIMIQKLFRGNVKITFEDYKYNYSGDLILVIGKDSEDI